MKYAIVVVAVVLSVALFAVGHARIQDNLKQSRTDYKCLNECTSKGYSWGFCKNLCSY